MVEPEQRPVYEHAVHETAALRPHKVAASSRCKFIVLKSVVFYNSHGVIADFTSITPNSPGFNFSIEGIVANDPDDTDDLFVPGVRRKNLAIRVLNFRSATIEVTMRGHGFLNVYIVGARAAYVCINPHLVYKPLWSRITKASLVWASFYQEGPSSKENAEDLFVSASARYLQNLKSMDMFSDFLTACVVRERHAWLTSSLTAYLYRRFKSSFISIRKFLEDDNQDEVYEFNIGRPHASIVIDFHFVSSKILPHERCTAGDEIIRAFVYERKQAAESSPPPLSSSALPPPPPPPPLPPPPSSSSISPSSSTTTTAPPPAMAPVVVVAAGGPPGRTIPKVHGSKRPIDEPASPSSASKRQRLSSGNLVNHPFDIEQRTSSLPSPASKQPPKIPSSPSSSSSSSLSRPQSTKAGTHSQNLPLSATNLPSPKTTTLASSRHQEVPGNSTSPTTPPPPPPLSSSPKSPSVSGTTNANQAHFIGIVVKSPTIQVTEPDVNEDSFKSKTADNQLKTSDPYQPITKTGKYRDYRANTAKPTSAISGGIGGGSIISETINFIDAERDPRLNTSLKFYKALLENRKDLQLIALQNEKNKLRREELKKYEESRKLSASPVPLVPSSSSSKSSPLFLQAKPDLVQPSARSQSLEGTSLPPSKPAPSSQLKNATPRNGIALPKPTLSQAKPNPAVISHVIPDSQSKDVSSLNEILPANEVSQQKESFKPSPQQSLKQKQQKELILSPTRVSKQKKASKIASTPIRKVSAKEVSAPVGVSQLRDISTPKKAPLKKVPSTKSTSSPKLVQQLKPVLLEKIRTLSLNPVPQLNAISPPPQETQEKQKQQNENGVLLPKASSQSKQVLSARVGPPRPRALSPMKANPQLAKVALAKDVLRPAVESRQAKESVLVKEVEQLKKKSQLNEVVQAKAAFIPDAHTSRDDEAQQEKLNPSPYLACMPSLIPKELSTRKTPQPSQPYNVLLASQAFSLLANTELARTQKINPTPVADAAASIASASSQEPVSSIFSKKKTTRNAGSSVNSVSAPQPAAMAEKLKPSGEVSTNASQTSSSRVPASLVSMPTAIKTLTALSSTPDPKLTLSSPLQSSSSSLLSSSNANQIVSPLKRTLSQVIPTAIQHGHNSSLKRTRSLSLNGASTVAVSTDAAKTLTIGDAQHAPAVTDMDPASGMFADACEFMLRQVQDVEPADPVTAAWSDMRDQVKIFLRAETAAQTRRHPAPSSISANGAWQASTTPPLTISPTISSGKTIAAKDSDGWPVLLPGLGPTPVRVLRLPVIRSSNEFDRSWTCNACGEFTVPNATAGTALALIQDHLRTHVVDDSMYRTENRHHNGGNSGNGFVESHGKSTRASALGSIDKLIFKIEKMAAQWEIASLEHESFFPTSFEFDL
ncbi:hypothetical protein V1514DRAFT_349580 [Lipomyces japonicus]|uniref:uncharacterized protein n=1 Tax=Lipomyces japonicus TaxID=56871 RepID=UPI0034CE0C43